jgi:CRISPR-associated protein Csm5
MKYRVTVLTPTLVGSGEKLAPIDYMVWRDQVNVLDQARIFKLLAKGPRLESYLTQLSKATRLDFASWGGFAQNFAGRRIPFEDAAYTSYWNNAPIEAISIPTFAAGTSGPYLPGAALRGALRTAMVFENLKPGALRDAANQLTGDRIPRHPAEQLERQAVGGGGADRLRAFAVADSGARPTDAFRIYMLRVATLVAKAPNQYALGWKHAGRGTVQRAEDSTPSFAEMAAPGTTFEGTWGENAFLNRDEVRTELRWSKPSTREALFEAANAYAAKQLELHAQYAAWTGLSALGASVDSLKHRLEAVRSAGGCLLSVGLGAGFLSKSAAIGGPEADYRKLIGLLPFYQRAIQSGLPFPKTRRIVFLKNKPASLAGWVELSIQ